MNITTNILDIIKSNKKIEQIIEIEKRLDKIKCEIKEAKNSSEIMHLKKLLDTEMQLKIDQTKLKDILNKEELELYKNIMIYLEYNNYADEIRKIEKISKKSSYLDSTVNSEGRKKEIDRNLVTYYNSCVSKKNEISKEYMRAFNILQSYKLTDDISQEKEIKKSEEVVPVITINESKQEIKEDSSKIEKAYKRKMKKFLTGLALGVAAYVSLFSFGNSKNTQTKEDARIEKETTFETNDIEDTVNVTSNQIKDDKNAEKRVITHEFVDKISSVKTEGESESLTIGDSFTVSNDSKIMVDEYEATYYENGKTPYYNSDEYRVVEAVVYEMPDGKIVVARNKDEIDYCECVNGKNVTAYLSSSQYGIEGFYNSQDVIARKRIK
ncbi:MAG: hypothetical protein E7158_04080 [Firmicutes bacterium]|nr:hypothetical protein [Bacillota bacterium]